ncbi:serine/threonine protein kinase [Frankia sp. CcI49]|uniref:protein kinase domain-containing protein n=1 Tax=Frankia sp. CcI49 TaxID=1745382 RepID=UPI000978C1FF|nr:protein kinase [Frankia sp. CcI49]ONH56221.1 serine/threonine protein kinase [Frankia sp. CcI49]
MLTPLTTDDPQQIGPYQLTNRIGAGGMGVVYLGFTDDGRAAAVKVPATALVGDPSFRSRFRQEVAAASRVRGRTVAAVLDSDATGPRPWLATEYVEGRSLSEAVLARGPFDERLVSAVAVGLADALVSIHAAGVVHRDLKPANILLAWDGPRVIDFGVARDDATTSLTRTGSLVGTMAWMAPEQLRGERAGPAADIFAWGACVAFAAAGRPAFRGEQPQAVALAILNGAPDLENLPPLVAPQVHAALRKNPQARPGAAEILANLLGRPADAPTDPAETGRLMRSWWSPPPGTEQAPHPPPPRPRPTHTPMPAPGPGPARAPRPQVPPSMRAPEHPREGQHPHPRGGQPAHPGNRQPPHPRGGPPPRPRDGQPAPRARRRALPVAALLALGLLLAAGGAVAGALAMSHRNQGTAGTAGTVTPTPGSPGITSATASPAGSATGPSASTTTSQPPRIMTATEAASVVRREGYTPDMASYDPQRTLNLVRATRGDRGRHEETAFVFADGKYLGTDTRDPSTSISVEPLSSVEAEVTYRTYPAGGSTPTGSAVVRFRWDGTKLRTDGQFPPADPALPDHR